MGEKILVVDDSQIDTLTLKKMLEGYEVICATCGDEMWEVLNSDYPAVILLDVIMPGDDGFKIAKKLSSIDKFSDIPIIFITSKDTGQDVEEGFDSGADDYIKKPFNEVELRARIRSTLLKKNQERDLREKTITDPLTGIYNRRYFFEVMEKNIEHIKRNKRNNFSVAIIDIDRFKDINDTYGHLAGDFILKVFADYLKKRIRPYDLLARYGGEEFIIMFMDCNRDFSGEVLQRIKDFVESNIYKYEDKDIKFTFSSGVSDTKEIQADDFKSDDLVKIADERLYMAKQSGRNKIVIDIIAK